MLVLLPDRQITRRKRTHLVVNLEGDVQFAASKIGDVFDWLNEADTEKVTVEVETGARYLLVVTRFTNPLQVIKPGEDKAASDAYDEVPSKPLDKAT